MCVHNTEFEMCTLQLKLASDDKGVGLAGSEAQAL